MYIYIFIYGEAPVKLLMLLLRFICCGPRFLLKCMIVIDCMFGHSATCSPSVTVSLKSFRLSSLFIWLLCTPTRFPLD